MEISKCTQIFKKILKFLGSAPFSVENFEISMKDFVKPLLILCFYISLLILRVKIMNEMDLTGSNYSKMTLILIIGFAVFFVFFSLLINLSNRWNVKKLLECFEDIEKKVKKSENIKKG